MLNIEHSPHSYYQLCLSFYFLSSVYCYCDCIVAMVLCLVYSVNSVVFVLVINCWSLLIVRFNITTP